MEPAALEALHAWLGRQRHRTDDVGRAARFARTHGTAQLVRANHSLADPQVRRLAAAALRAWVEEDRSRAATRRPETIKPTGGRD